jgi:hypothetical protein
MKLVVDTNVPIVANGKSEQASPECVKNCAVRIRQLTTSGRIVLDDKWLILKEYMANLISSGQPGIGDAFLKWVLTNLCNPKFCEQVRITPKNSAKTDFEEFPSDPGLEKFDPNDRKFVAVAATHPDRPPILQAVDTKWWEMKESLDNVGITIDFLCKDDIRKILKKKKQTE